MCWLIRLRVVPLMTQFDQEAQLTNVSQSAGPLVLFRVLVNIYIYKGMIQQEIIPCKKVAILTCILFVCWKHVGNGIVTPAFLWHASHVGLGYLLSCLFPSLVHALPHLLRCLLFPLFLFLFALPISFFCPSLPFLPE